MMAGYKLSIIIPTKNREYYCKRVIEQVLAATSTQTEIVIQDNSDSDELELFVKGIDEERIVYNHEKRVLSFVDNFSEAVALAHGEYLCMIGDDDGILPNIEDVVKYAESQDLDAVIPGLNSVYVWPASNSIIKGGEEGYLVLSYIDKTSIKDISAQDGLKQVLRNGCLDYQNYDIPRLYHGLVHKRVLEKIKATLGTYFGGLTPDMYMAVALGLTCEKVQVIRYPITISGICPASGSASSATGAHTGELKDAPHFKGHVNYQWDSCIPYIYTVETIWAETALQALNDFLKEDYRKEFNLCELGAQLWNNYPQFKDRIIKHMKTHDVNVTKLKCAAIRRSLFKKVKRIWKRIVRKPNEVIKNYGVFDIVNACELTMKVLDGK